MFLRCCRRLSKSLQAQSFTPITAAVIEYDAGTPVNAPLTKASGTASAIGRGRHAHRRGRAGVAVECGVGGFGGGLLGAAICEADSVGEDDVSGGGGLVLLAGLLAGLLGGGDGVVAVVVTDGSTWLPCPWDCLDTNSTADTRIAMTATPIAPRAITDGDVRYHGTGSRRASSP